MKSVILLDRRVGANFANSCGDRHEVIASRLSHGNAWKLVLRLQSLDLLEWWRLSFRARFRAVIVTISRVSCYAKTRLLPTPCFE